MNDLHEIRCEWLPDEGVWSRCLTCGRPAWSHRNSDPLADVLAAYKGIKDGVVQPYAHPATKQVP